MCFFLVCMGVYAYMYVCFTYCYELYRMPFLSLRCIALFVSDSYLLDIGIDIDIDIIDIINVHIITYLVSPFHNKIG